MTIYLTICYPCHLHDPARWRFCSLLVHQRYWVIATSYVLYPHVAKTARNLHNCHICFVSQDVCDKIMTIVIFHKFYYFLRAIPTDDNFSPKSTIWSRYEQMYHVGPGSIIAEMNHTVAAAMKLEGSWLKFRYSLRALDSSVSSPECNYFPVLSLVEARRHAKVWYLYYKVSLLPFYQFK